jgi:hypothetical protein
MPPAQRHEPDTNGETPHNRGVTRCSAAGSRSRGVSSQHSRPPILVDQLRHRLADRELKLELTPSARHHIAEQGFDRVFGARQLRRFLQHEVETRIGRSLLAGNVEDGSTTPSPKSAGELVVTWANPTSAATSSDDPTEGVLHETTTCDFACPGVDHRDDRIRTSGCGGQPRLGVRYPARRCRFLHDIQRAVRDGQLRADLGQDRPRSARPR